MPELSESIQAIREGAKEDRFTYLTILQYHATTPEILPTLNEVLDQDAELTQEIGWDLVQMLLGIEGSETCLETVARLGNPREVVIKVMEALEGLAVAWNEVIVDVDEPGVIPESNIPAKFITLLGMLAILHRRIETKYPSRFLGPSLVKVFEAYQPTPEMTASIINLVYSLSGRKRPPLPTRKSSINVANPDQDGDASKNAPDPEAEQEDPKEEAMQRKLLQSFVTCILQRYANAHDMLWSPRLLEVYYPKKVVPGRKTITEAFREDEDSQQRDGVIGQLVALLRDLSLDKCPREFVKSIYEGASLTDPLEAFDDFSSVDDIHLSPGGAVCLIAYWIFSKDVFGSDSPEPEMHIFPDHALLLARFLGREMQSEIISNPGIADALLAIGLGLEHRNLIKGPEDANLMAYHHNLTLISVFHPDIQVRNAATSFAGSLLHAEPDDQDRLDILEDLLENCMFASLKACAVTWLKEEILAAKQANLSNQFSSPDVVERLQYSLFPDMLSLIETGGSDGGEQALVDFWAQNQLFLLQVANFAYFLFTGFPDLVPAGMGAAVGQRFVEPLVAAAERLQKAAGARDDDKMQLGILVDRLRSLGLQ
ncbi:Cation-independent mannose-6-phosphate receptor CI-MPR [Hypoxylon texense]